MREPVGSAEPTTAPRFEGTAVRVGVPPAAPVRITVDGAAVSCYAGETLAAALLVAGVRAFRRDRDGAARQPLCNMGTCFECVVTVNDAPLSRSCLIPVTDGMTVETGDGG